MTLDKTEKYCHHAPEILPPQYRPPLSPHGGVQLKTRQTLAILLVAIVAIVSAYFVVRQNQAPVPPTTSTTDSSATSSPSANPFGVMAPDAAPPDTAIHLNADEAAIINDAVASLTRLATRSATARELLAFYNGHAVRAHIIEAGVIVAAEHSKSTDWFAVAAIPTAHNPGPGASVVDATFGTADRVMIISRSTRKDLYRGLLFAHELVHAEDAVLGGEPPSAQMSPTWLMGELHAHHMVKLILNEYSHGAWQKAIAAGDAWRTAKKAELGRRADAYITSFDDRDSTRVVRALGPLDTNDLASILVQYIVDVNMEVVNRAAGRDSRAFRGRSIDMMHSLYRTYAPADMSLRR